MIHSKALILKVFLTSFMVMAGVFLVSFPDKVFADDRGNEALQEKRVDPMRAVPPKPTYFPDEAHSLNKTAPAAGPKPTDEAMIGSMVLQDNAAYSQKDQNTLKRLRALSDSLRANKEETKVDVALDVMPESPVLSPDAAWLVGPSKASRMAEGDPKGCLALNQFSNDFILGIHASDQVIKGLTIDTRQSVFKTDEVYPVAMSLGDDSYALMALASSQSTLAISLEDVPSFGHKATLVGVIRLVVGNSPMYFSTAGLADGLKRLQECLKSKGASTLKVANSTSGQDVVQGLPANADFWADQSAVRSPSIMPMPITNPGKDVPIALAVTELIPSGHRFVIDAGVDPMTPVSWDIGVLWFDVLKEAVAEHGLYVGLSDKVVMVSRTPPLSASAVQSVDAGEPTGHQRASFTGHRVWEAPQGSSLKTVLYDWASEAGVRPQIDLDQDFVLEQEFFYDGTLEDAVALLMLRFEGEEGAPRMMMRRDIAMSSMRSGSQNLPSSRLARYSDMVGQPAPELERIGYLPSKYYNARPSAPGLSNNTWRALEGADLETILGQWTDQAQVRLVWDMDQVLELKESVRLQGSFTDAITGVLQQYASDPIRPVAQLNNDPATREQVLIIRLARVGTSQDKEDDASIEQGTKGDDAPKPSSKPNK